MKTLGYLVLGITVASFAVPAYADREKNENGHGRHKYERQVGKGGEFKEEYWDGNCKVERKLERNGSYKEERKCEGPGRHAVAYPAPHPPVAYPAPHPQPGVVIQPPSVVIRPPAVVIR